nr:MAG TPA: hypothetical protein [Caudoviricetes sp.]
MFNRLGSLRSGPIFVLYWNQNNRIRYFTTKTGRRHTGAIG